MKIYTCKSTLSHAYKAATIGILLCLTMLAAQSPIALAAEDTAILKVIHNERVRSIMRRLNNLLYERELTQLELQRLRHKQIRRLVEESKKLTAAAASLPDDYSLKQLTDEQQLAFSAMANQLYEASLELQRETEAGHRKALDDAYSRLQETCHTCHSLFRNW